MKTGKLEKNSEINIIEKKNLRNELQGLYKSNNGYDYVLFKNKIKEF